MHLFRLKTVLAAAAIAVVGTSSAFAATVYHATSNVKEGAGNHSLWFSGDNPPGAIGDNTAGNQKNHFKFENRSPGFGTFTVDGTSASLSGELANGNGQAFQLDVYFTEFTGSNVGYKTINGGPDGSAWTLYELDTSRTSTLSYIPGTGDAALPNFVFSSLRGSNSDGPFKVQVGVGANDKDATLFGLSTWFTLTEEGCSANCTPYHGDINIVLEPVPLPAAGFMLIAGVGGLFAMRRRKKAS